MSYFTCPNGHMIRGTLESVLGTALRRVFRARDGSIQIEYEGEGTEICWDSQETVKEDENDVYVCEDGCHTKQCDLVECQDEPEDEPEDEPVKVG